MMAGRLVAARHQRHLLVAVGCAVALHLATVAALRGAPGSGERNASARATVMLARIVEMSPTSLNAAAATLLAPAPPALEVAESAVSTVPQPSSRALQAAAPPLPSVQPAASMPSSSTPATVLTVSPPMQGLGAALDVGPRPLADISPEVPAGAGARGGSVTLHLVISERGEVEKVAVVSASPPGIFEESALAAFGRARYAPAQKAGVAVRSEVTYQVDFAGGVDASSKTY